MITRPSYGGYSAPSRGGYGGSPSFGGYGGSPSYGGYGRGPRGPTGPRWGGPSGPRYGGSAGYGRSVGPSEHQDSHGNLQLSHGGLK